jgi:hypothetical protein
MSKPKSDKHIDITHIEGSDNFICYKIVYEGAVYLADESGQVYRALKPTTKGKRQYFNLVSKGVNTAIARDSIIN